MAIQKITSNVLADGAVSASNLEDNSVTSAKLANNSVGIDQLNLSDGTDGQLLKTNGSGTLSFVDAGGGGRWTQISSTTLNPASPVNSVEFTNFVDAAYSEYEIRWTGFSTNSSVTNEVDLYMQVALEGYTVNIGGVNTFEGYNNADYAFVNWYNKPDNVSTTPLLIKNRTQGYLKLSQVYGQWNDTYPKSFGKINITGSMVSWECNMHAGGRNTSPDDRFALHRNWGLGYNWGSNGVRDIVKVRLYSANSSNEMQMGTFTLYGLSTS